MTAEQLISFARGAPSIDIVDVDGLKAAAVRAFETDPVGMTAYGTSIGYVPLRTVDRRQARRRRRPGADHERIAAGRRVPVRLPGRAGRRGGGGEARPTTGRCSNLKNLGAEVHQVTLDSDGIDVAELRKLLESGVRPKLAHIIPNFQNPAGVTLSATAPHRAAQPRQGVRVHHLRGRPVRGHPIPRRQAAEHAVAGHRRCGGARQLVHQDGLPRRPGRLSGRSQSGDRRHRQAGDQPLHLARHGVRGDRAPVLRLR